MQGVIVLVIFLLVVFLILPIVTAVRVGGLAEEIRRLRKALEQKMIEEGGTRSCASAPEVVVQEADATERVPPEGAVQEADATDPPSTGLRRARRVPPTGTTGVSPVAEPTPEPTPEPPKREPPPAPPEPTAIEVLIDRIGDWLAVRGEFAPKGMTREFAVATRWLARAGLLILVLSVIYFVKLSIERGWVGPTARIAATVLWGAVGVAGGVAMVKRTRYAFLGHAIAALGFVALFLGFGLGHRYFVPPVIVSPVFAFIALVLVTVAMGMVSVALPSPTIAVMGLVGGYLVPVIAGRDTGNPLGLCCYLLVLNCGAYAVARLRGWSALDFMASMASFAMMWGWCGTHRMAGHGHLLTVFVFMLLVHALYMVSVVRGANGRDKVGNSLAWAGLAINAGMLLAWLGLRFRGAFGDPTTGLIFMGMVAAYLAMAHFSTRRGWLDRTSVNILLVFAMVFLALAPLLLFSRPWCVVSWSLMGVAAVEAERRTQQKLLGVVAALFLVAAAVAGLFAYMPVEYIDYSHADQGTHNLNYFVGLLLRLVRLWTLPLALGWVAWRKASPKLVAVAAFFVFVFLTGESYRFGRCFIPRAPSAAVTLAWTLAASGCLYAGVARAVRSARMVGLALLGLAVAKLMIYDIEGYAMPIRVAVFAVVGVLLMAGAFLYMKYRSVFERKDEKETSEKEKGDE